MTSEEWIDAGGLGYSPYSPVYWTSEDWIDAGGLAPGYGAETDWEQIINAGQFPAYVASPEQASGIVSAIKKLGSNLFFDKATGDPNWKNIATIGGGLAGLIGTRFNKPEKVGYQGQVPTITAVRARVPQPADVGRPGAGGRRYLSDVQYAIPGQEAGAQQAALAQAQGLAAANAARPVPAFAAGGIASGYYLGGKTDGMADEIPASIDGKQPAKLSDGEFVVPADVVSHLGNGNSEAGAQRLYEMMDRIRKARTGTTKQGKQINPNKFLPK